MVENQHPCLMMWFFESNRQLLMLRSVNWHQWILSWSDESEENNFIWVPLEKCCVVWWRTLYGYYLSGCCHLICSTDQKWPSDYCEVLPNIIAFNECAYPTWWQLRWKCWASELNAVVSYHHHPPLNWPCHSNIRQQISPCLIHSIGLS